MEPTYPEWCNKIHAAVENGNYAQADFLCHSAIMAAPNKCAHSIRHALVMMGLGRWMEVAKLVNQAKQQRPSDEQQAWLAFLNSVASIKKRQDASGVRKKLEDADRYLRQIGQNTQLRCQVLVHLAYWTACHQGEKKAAPYREGARRCAADLGYSQDLWRTDTGEPGFPRRMSALLASVSNA